MAFQLKSFVGIVASMVNHMRATQTRVTDFRVGSVARTMLEAPAVEIEELYQQVHNGLKEAIPVSVYNSFDFARLPARPAIGVITYTIMPQSAPLTIPAGTVFSASSGEISYVSQGDVTIPHGQPSAAVLVSATRPGARGNRPAGGVFTPSFRPPGFVSAVNAAALIDGADQESDEERKQRFGAFVSTLSRATGAALAYGARQAVLNNAQGVETERVRAVAVVEPWRTDPEQPIGLVRVVVHNGVGSTSVALRARVLDLLNGHVGPDGVAVPGWKAAGVKVEVAAATEQAVNITAAVTPSAGVSGAALAALADGVMTDYVQALDIGQPFLFTEAIHRVKQLAGVADFTVSAPTANITPAATTKLMPGAITVTTA